MKQSKHQAYEDDNDFTGSIPPWAENCFCVATVAVVLFTVILIVAAVINY